MGAFLDKPKTEKHNECGLGNGLQYGLSSMQGWRIEMEDSHTAIPNLPGKLKDWAFFAVFDGHAGARVSAHCSEHLLNSITSGEEFQSSSVTDGSGDEDISESVRRGILGGFLRLDDNMRQMPEVASGEDRSGTTAVCALISPTYIYVANCGDSRAVLSRASGIGFHTLDHKPINPTEKERIQNAGGSVMIQRVNGSLAVSRALGDYEYKNVEGKGQCEQLVSPEPEIYIEKRLPEDEFIVLACDGIWDVMTNEDICAFIRSRLQVTDDLASVCNTIVDTCLFKGSRDNMSVVLITFPGAPKVSDEAVKREKETDDLIQRKVEEVCEQEGVVTLPQIMQVLSEEQLPNLPPGGGLQAKRGFIETLFMKLKPECANLDEHLLQEDEVGGGVGALENLTFLPSSAMRGKMAAIFEANLAEDGDEMMGGEGDGGNGEG